MATPNKRGIKVPRCFLFLLGILSISLHVGCLPDTGSREVQKGKEDLLKIIRRRDCYAYFENVTTFDVCIYKISPYFDKLSVGDRESVVVELVLHGRLDAGSATAFSQLINPYKKDLSRSLSENADQQLQEMHSLSARQARRYRKKLEYFLQQDTPRRW